MKRFLLTVILYLAIPTYSIKAAEVPDIYIAAEGNNKFETQIKANKRGMQKVALMIADKMGINYLDIGKIPYLKLKEVFTISSVTNETSTESHYSATVKYIYDIYSINRLLRDYGNQSVNDKFYEYLVFPIFKQRKVINIWHNNNDWNKKWTEARDVLERKKFFYPKANNELMQKINSQNIFNLSYEDFLDIFQDKLLKKVMLVVCEYFTDINTGKAIIGVQFNLLDYNDKKTIIVKEYPINKLEEIPHIIDKVITSTIREYDNTNGVYHKNINISLDKVKNTSTENYREAQKSIIMDITISDDNELDEVTKKLNNTKEIAKFTITHDHDQKYKMCAFIKSSEFALAESFYLNGLSYKKYGNIYRLINIQKGF